MAVSPEMRAIGNAYDACGIMLNKTHQDEHLRTITKYGLTAWQLGFKTALENGKHNVPAYVARCAESAYIQATRGNGQSASIIVDNETAGYNDPATIEARRQRLAKQAQAAPPAGGAPAGSANHKKRRDTEMEF